MIEEYLSEMYERLLRFALKNREITQNNYEYLLLKNPRTLDELWDAYHELVHFLQNDRYYAILDRIEKGEAILADETDPVKKRRYRQALDELGAELETLMPKEETA